MKEEIVMGLKGALTHNTQVWVYALPLQNIISIELIKNKGPSKGSYILKGILAFQMKEEKEKGVK